MFKKLNEIISYPLVITVSAYVGFVTGLIFSALTKSVTDWIMATCTIGILLGTYKAANYAKKSASYSRMQMKANLLPDMEKLQEISKLLTKLEFKLRGASLRCTFISKTEEKDKIVFYCEVIKQTYIPKNFPKSNQVITIGIDELSKQIRNILEPNALKIRLYSGYDYTNDLIELIDYINVNIANLLYHYNELKKPMSSDESDYIPLMGIKDVSKDIPAQFEYFQKMKKEFESALNKFYYY